MYYHSRISYLSIRRIRYIPPHDPPSGQHRGKQVQCDANPEGVREDRHIEQHPRREEDIPARPQKIEPRHEEGVTEDEHQHVGEEQEKAAIAQKYLDRAGTWLEELKSQEEEKKEQLIAAQKVRLADAEAKMEHAYTRYGDNWVDTLFHQTVDIR